MQRLTIPHIGLAYLAAFVKGKGLDCQFSVLDMTDDFSDRPRKVQDRLSDFGPDIIGISVFSPLAQEARLLIREIKGLTNIPVVVGGPHVSVVGDEFLAETGADYGIIMDGEIPFYELLKALFVRQDKSTLAEIPGLIFQNSQGHYVSQPNTNMIVDLDEIPFPDYSIYDLSRYSAFQEGRMLLSSRGCPYSCTYCAAPLVTGRRYRKRSAHNFIAEMELYIQQGIKRFGVFDDAFNIDLNRAKEICRLMIEKGFNIQWELANGIRANTVDREFFQLLKRSGCTIVGFGLESGHPEVLKSIKKGLTLEDIYRALEMVREVGITAPVNLIIGHPGETYETAMETLRLAEKLPASYVNIYGLIPMKGTEAYRELKEREALGKAKFFYEYEYYMRHCSSQGIDPVFETPEFTGEQRRKLLKKARRITQKTAMKYRLGGVLGTAIYALTLNDKVFNILNNIRSTRWGSMAYDRFRRKG